MDSRAQITVSGEAEVGVVPDRVVLSFGIEVRDTDIQVAKRKNQEILRRVVAAWGELGLRERDIQTDHLAIEPVWDDSSYIRRKNVSSYIARIGVMVRLNRPELADQVVTLALQAGANQVNGIDFQTSELKKYRDQARELALLAARDKARKMAAVLGKSIGEAMQITERAGGSSYASGGRGASIGSSQTQVYAEGPAAGADSAEGIPLGQIGVRASVMVVFALDNK